MQQHYAIIVAGGSGSRMNSDLPKQFLCLDGKPILMHTLNRFAESACSPHIILVLHADMIAYWEACCREHHYTVPHQIVSGGKTRFQSVKQGLQTILQAQPQALDKTLIAIHDAARPVIRPALIDRCYQQTEIHGATVLAVASTNSIRQGDPVNNKALDREKVWLVQTPQTFRGDILQEAFKQDELPTFTDDASVVEKLGYRIQLIPGDPRNIKITFPEDLAIAQYHLSTLTR